MGVIKEEIYQRREFPGSQASPSCALHRLSPTHASYLAAEMGIQVSRQLTAIQGDLFMLGKFIFVSKQPVLIDIHQVVFSRVSANIATARTFDMQIITKHGPEYIFTSINKDEHELTDTVLGRVCLQFRQVDKAEAHFVVMAAGVCVPIQPKPSTLPL